MKKDFWDDKKSLSGKRWRKKQDHPDTSKEIARKHNLPELIARIISNKNIRPDDVEKYLTPKLKTDLPDPLMLKDMDTAIEIASNAVKKNEKILIFGDYDVDGITSTALLYLWLKRINPENIPETVIPEREDGYGMDFTLLDKLKEKKIDLLILVDSGTTAFETIEAVIGLGIKIIVLDHHEPAETLPKATAIVNPKRKDQENAEALRIMAAVGVVFLFTVALSRKLREDGWFAEKNTAEPDLREYMDLVALGTVCDVMPLVGINRLFVKYSLSNLTGIKNRGMKALAENLSGPISTYHYGFIFGPKINAGGRMGAAYLGFDLLTSENEEDAKKVLEKLDEMNAHRKAIEQTVLQEAVNLADPQKDGPVILVKKKDWYHGVIGIVAGRLREKYNLPACVVTIQDGVAKGSGRSTPDIDLGAAIMSAVRGGLLEKGGGHAMAAGFTVSEEKLGDFETFLKKEIDQNKTSVDEKESETLWIDSLLSLSGANMDLLSQLMHLEPFGEGNEEPVFALPNVYIDYAEIVGGGHIKCMLSSMDGSRLKGIAFRVVDTPLGNALLEAKGRAMDIAAKIKLESYRGKRSAQLMILDVAHSAVTE